METLIPLVAQAIIPLLISMGTLLMTRNSLRDKANIQDMSRLEKLFKECQNDLTHKIIELERKSTELETEQKKNLMLMERLIEQRK